MTSRVLGNFKSPRIKVQGYWVTIDMELRGVILGKTDGDCLYCGRELNFRKPHAKKNPTGFTVDHFVPKRLGGSDKLSNLVPTCCQCNNMKGQIHPKDWLSPELYNKLRKEIGLLD